MTLIDFDPDGEVKLARRDALPALRPARGPAARARVRALTTDERLDAAAGLRGRAGQPPPQAGPGARAHRLPLRRPGRLRRVPRPAAAPHAHHRVAAALARATATSARPRSTTPATARTFDAAMERSADLYDALRRAVPAAGALRRLPGLPGPLRHADERPRGDAPHRAAHRSPGPPRIPACRARRCTA